MPKVTGNFSRRGLLLCFLTHENFRSKHFAEHPKVEVPVRGVEVSEGYSDAWSMAEMTNYDMRDTRNLSCVVSRKGRDACGPIVECPLPKGIRGENSVTKRESCVCNGPYGTGQGTQMSMSLSSQTGANQLQVKAAGPSSSWIQAAIDAPEDFVALDGRSGGDSF